MVEIAIISDTHMQRGARQLPASCVARLRAADLIVHAGDLVTVAVLRELECYGELIAVHGNVDTVDVRAMLPARREFGAGGATIGVLHDAGPAPGRLRRMRALFPRADAVIFGHSHIPLHERSAGGFQIFNPGSPTERRQAPDHTMGIARVEPGAVTFGLVVLG